MDNKCTVFLIVLARNYKQNWLLSATIMSRQVEESAAECSLQDYDAGQLSLLTDALHWLHRLDIRRDVLIQLTVIIYPNVKFWISPGKIKGFKNAKTIGTCMSYINSLLWATALLVGIHIIPFILASCKISKNNLLSTPTRSVCLLTIDLWYALCYLRITWGSKGTLLCLVYYILDYVVLHVIKIYFFVSHFY